MSSDIKPITIKNLTRKIPLILNNKIILKKELLPFKGSVKLVKSLNYQEDVLYEAKTGDFLCGDAQELIIVNRLNKTNNSCRTIARCKSKTGQFHERTSDEVAKVIGQTNYDTLFSTLCSVINQEIKIRGIYSLLTVPKVNKSESCQTENFKSDGIHTSVSLEEKQCQTNESFISQTNKSKMKRRAKRAQLTPYVVQEEPEVKKQKRLVIKPSDFETILKCKDSPESQKSDPVLPDLGTEIFDESSNGSDKLSVISVNTTPDLLFNPMNMLNTIDRLTSKETVPAQDSQYRLHNLDAPINKCGPEKPAVLSLAHLSPEQRIQMLMQQGLNDWKNCLTQDNNGHLPIHVAVLNNDLDLLKRQCLVLKMKDIHVDIPADNLTPLRMSLYQENVQMTTILLQHNADPLDTDDTDRTCFHIAAEMATDHLQALVNHCEHNARKILEDNEDLWKSQYSEKTDTELYKILVSHISNLCDNQGYTPLMLASRLGRYENVKLLVECSPETVNSKMPSSGNTSLYLAVGAACIDSGLRGNKSKVVDHFRKTIEILVENGADPNLSNFAGGSVNDLLTEHSISDLSMLIANKLTSRYFPKGTLPTGTQKYDSFMLVKDQDGNVDLEKVEKDRSTRKKPAPKKKKMVAEQKPFIILKPNNRDRQGSTKATSPNISLKTTLKTTAESIQNSTVVANSSLVQNVKSFKLSKPLILKSGKRKSESTESRIAKKSNIE